MNKQTIEGVVAFRDHDARKTAVAKIYLMFNEVGKAEIQLHTPETGAVSVVAKDSPVVEELVSAIREHLDWVDVRAKEPQSA